MAKDFSKDYWQQHWLQGHADSASGAAAMAVAPPNPHLLAEAGDLAPGSALDVGCGAGAEAIWLAARGWQVTAADIAAPALAVAVDRAAEFDVGSAIAWVEADLTSWVPPTTFDLVTTFYAHPDGSQLAFYERISSWVAPGGTLLIVGHASAGGDHPHEASVSGGDVVGVLDEEQWEVLTAEERRRSTDSGMELHDVVVRAVRRQPWAMSANRE